MAEESLQEKTETPTEHRRQEIRKEGRVAYSKEMTASIGLGVIVLGFYFAGDNLLNKFLYMLRAQLTNLNWGELNQAAVIQSIAFSSKDLILFLLFFMLGLVVVGMLIGFMQLGVNLSWKPLQPNFSKVNPLQGFGRIFSLSNLVESIKITAKLILIGAIIYFIIMSDISRIARFMSMEYVSFSYELWQIIKSMMLKLFIAFLLIAGLDFIWQKFNFERQIKMTRQEYKEDLKQTEGDPMIKARIRKIQQNLSRARMLQEVPTADVVIANPTHYAVVLKYDADYMAAPQVVAKGVDFLALRIIEIATKSGVMVTRRPEVARGLYAALDVGDAVPAEFYKVIAEILAQAYKAKNLSMPKAS